jgi:hypothetical protein
MGVEPALTNEEETLLFHYIEYLANRGFPMTIHQILGVAWCIAEEKVKVKSLVKTGLPVFGGKILKKVIRDLALESLIHWTEVAQINQMLRSYRSTSSC